MLICTTKSGKLLAPNRGKESRKYIRCGEMSPEERLQGTEIAKEILGGEPVKLFQLGDSFCVEDSLQLPGWKSFDEHEYFDLGEFDARDSFLRHLTVI